jgi:P27 family predicted phage terminase small subunit
LKPEDYAALLQHCQTWQTYITAIREVRAEGVTVSNPQTGCPRRNPALSAAETAGAQLLASCREFGLTPSSEHRLAAASAEDDGDDPFAGWPISAADSGAAAAIWRGRTGTLDGGSGRHRMVAGGGYGRDDRPPCCPRIVRHPAALARSSPL